MRKLISLFIILVFTLSGCSLLRPPTLDPNYSAYERIMVAKFEADRKPLVEFDLDSEGRMSNFAMYPLVPDVKVEQKKSSAWFRLAEVGFKYLGWIGLAWQTGEALEGVIEASTGNSTYMNSYNNNSKNSGEITALTDYSDTKTDTVDTEVETSE